MSLTIPYRFAQDLKTRNTRLVPVVIIGNIIEENKSLSEDALFLSTNDITIDTFERILEGASQEGVRFRSRHYKPLILDIPKISESLDIFKRKYKISSLSLKISNAMYGESRII